MTNSRSSPTGPVAILTNRHWGPWKWQQAPAVVEWTAQDRIVVTDARDGRGVLFDAPATAISSARQLLTFLRLRTDDGRRMTVDVAHAAVALPREGETPEQYADRAVRDTPDAAWWRSRLEDGGVRVPVLGERAAAGLGFVVVVAFCVVVALLMG